MADFPVNLKQVYFTRTIVVANPNHRPDLSAPVRMAPQNEINVQKLEDAENEYVVSMRTRFNPESDPSEGYTIDMECVALFDVLNISGDEALKAVSIVGHNVVYGAIREAVLWITGRHPFGALAFGLSVLEPKKADSKEPS
jgi:preprotein translocase subunit SecB